MGPFFGPFEEQSEKTVRGRALEAGTDMGPFFIVDNLAMDSRPLPPPLDPIIDPTYETWRFGRAL